MARPRTATAPPPAEQQQPQPHFGAFAAAAGAGELLPPEAAVAAAGTAAALTAAQITAATAAILAAFTSFGKTRQRQLRAHLTETIPRLQPDATPDEVSPLVRDEMEREQAFLDKQTERLKRDLPAALRLDTAAKRRDRLNAIIERERHYTQLREQHALQRSVARASFLEVKRQSPEGAYWMLGLARMHTPDCVAMSGQFWPWEVLDKIHPLLHPGCKCHLLSKAEAVERGLMHPDQVPDTADAVRRATQIARRYNLIQEAATGEEIAAYLDALMEATLRFAKGTHEGGRFRSATQVGHPSVRKFIQKALRDLVPSIPRSPAQRRRDHAGEWREVAGQQVYVPEHRAFEREIAGRHWYSPPGSTHVYEREDYVKRSPTVSDERGRQLTDTAERHRAEWQREARAVADNALAVQSHRAPPVEIGSHSKATHAGLTDAGFRLVDSEHDNTGAVTHSYRHPSSGAEAHVTYHRGAVRAVNWQPGRASKPKPLLNRSPDSLAEFLGDVHSIAHDLAARHESRPSISNAVVNQDLYDIAGTHTWDGQIELGRDTRRAIEDMIAARGQGRPLNYAESRSAYAAYRTAVHEAHHAAKPIKEGTYVDDSTARAIEEALTEELAGVEVADVLRRQGHVDVLRWLKANPTDARVAGHYSHYRHALSQVLDRGEIPPEKRRDVLTTLKFGFEPEQRASGLAALVTHGGTGHFQNHEQALAWVNDLFGSADARETKADPLSFTPNLRPDLSDIPDEPAAVVGDREVVPGSWVMLGERFGRVMNVHRRDDGPLFDVLHPDGKVERAVHPSEITRVGDKPAGSLPGAAEVKIGDEVIQRGDRVSYDNGSGGRSYATVERVTRAQNWMLSQPQGGWQMEASTDENEPVLLDAGRTPGLRKEALRGPASPGEPPPPDMPDDWSPAEKALVQQMRMMMTMRAGNFAGRENAPKYLGFEDYVLQHGMLFRHGEGEAPGEFEFHADTPKECFRNALMAAVAHPELTYVEGYAFNGLLPIHHAWLVDKEGNVYDPTWENIPGRNAADDVYIGIPFKTDYLTKTVVKKGSDTLLDWMGKGVPLDKAPTKAMLADDVKGTPIPKDFQGVIPEQADLMKQVFGRKAQEADYKEALHPRGRGGEWIAKLYHGTSKRNAQRILGSKSFGARSGVAFLTSHPGEARDYAGRGGVVIKTTARLKNPLIANGGEDLRKKLEALGVKNPSASPESERAQAEALRKAGHDGVVVHYPEDKRDPSAPMPARTVARVIDMDAIKVGHEKEEVEPKEWKAPPPPTGEGKKKGGKGYSSDEAYGTNTALGHVGEEAFLKILGGGRILHPEGKGAQSPLDVHYDDYGFEVKAVSTKSTAYKGTPKKHEISEKEAAAEEMGVQGALAIVVIDSDTGTAHAYYRDGLKGGRLSERTGWKYLGSTTLDNKAEVAAAHVSPVIREAWVEAGDVEGITDAIRTFSELQHEATQRYLHEDDEAALAQAREHGETVKMLRDTLSDVEAVREASFEERLHPRDRLGRWSEAMHRLHEITRADVEAGHVPGMRYDRAMTPGIAAHMYDREHITFGPGGFRGDKLDTLLTAHEVGHVVGSHLMASHGNVSKIPEVMAFRGEGEAFSRSAGYAPKFDNPFGASTRVEEMLADAYSELLHGGLRGGFDPYPGDQVRVPGRDEPGEIERHYQDYIHTDVRFPDGKVEKVERKSLLPPPGWEDEKPEGEHSQKRWALLKLVQKHARDLGLPDRKLYHWTEHGSELVEADYIERLHPRGRGGRWIKKLGLPRLDLKKPGEPTGSLKGVRRLSQATVRSRAQKVADAVVDFYGGDKVEVHHEPEYLASRGVDAQFRHKGEILPGLLYGVRVDDKLRDPEMGVEMYRLIAHEAAHSLSGTTPGPLPGFSQTFEEGGAEILSLWFWRHRGQEFDDRDAVRVEGKWTKGLDSLANHTVYRDWTEETLKRAASKVGWDRHALIDEVERVMRGDHGVRLRFRDETTTDVKPPEGVPDTAVGLMRWLLDDEAPINVGDDVALAAKLLQQGKRVELSQPRQVSVLLDKIAEIVRESREKGEDAPNFDLCKVTVRGTNLFCEQSKGIPRVKMPQFKGAPVPGGLADRTLEKNKLGRVSLDDAWRAHLHSLGVNVERTTEKASHLRATQRELVGATVARITHEIEAGRETLPIFVSRDNYVLDGHHQWASTIGAAARGDKVNDVDMPIERIDMPITDLIEEARSFVKHWGMQQQTETGEHIVVKEARFEERLHPRGRAGRWIPKFVLSPMGMPGSGKGTIGKLLAKEYGVPHISAGQMLRDLPRGSELGNRVHPLIERGDFVPDELVSEIVADRLRQPDVRNGVVLDGFPRTQAQVEYLERQGIPMKYVELALDKNVARERLLGRAKIENRADDTAEVIEHRFAVHEENTEPMLARLRGEGKLTSVRMEDVGPKENAERTRKRIEDTGGLAPGGAPPPGEGLYRGKPARGGKGRKGLKVPRSQMHDKVVDARAVPVLQQEALLEQRRKAMNWRSQAWKPITFAGREGYDKDGVSVVYGEGGETSGYDVYLYGQHRGHVPYGGGDTFHEVVDKVIPKSEQPGQQFLDAWWGNPPFSRGRYQRVSGDPGTLFEEQHQRIMEAGAAIDSEIAYRTRSTEEGRELAAQQKRLRVAKREVKALMEAEDKLAWEVVARYMGGGWTPEKAKAEYEQYNKDRARGRSPIWDDRASLYDAWEFRFNEAERQGVDLQGAYDKVFKAKQPMWDAEDKIKGLEREIKTVRRDKTFEVLRELRPFGGELQDTLRDDQPEKLKIAVENAPRWLPTDWITDSNEHDTTLRWEWHEERGHYQSNMVATTDILPGVEFHYSEIVVSPSVGLDLHRGEATTIHELVHRTEHVRDGVAGAEWAFYTSRVSPSTNSKWEEKKKLREVTGNTNYKEGEETRTDEFVNPYMGKSYGDEPDSYYEILSMGVEDLAEGAPLLSKDEEYRQFVLGALAVL